MTTSRVIPSPTARRARWRESSTVFRRIPRLVALTTAVVLGLSVIGGTATATAAPAHRPPGHAHAAPGFAPNR